MVIVCGRHCRIESQVTDQVIVVVSLVEVGLEHLGTDVEIRLVKVVRDVPTYLAVLASLQDDGMEERQNVDEG